MTGPHSQEISFEKVWIKVELFVGDFFFFAAKPSLWKSWLIAGDSHSCHGVESCRGKRHWMRRSKKVRAGWSPHTVLLYSRSVISFLRLRLLLLFHVIPATWTPVNPLLTVICQCDNTATHIESSLNCKAFILRSEGWELCSAAEASGKRNYLIDVLSAWRRQSHSVGPLMSEALSDWLTKLKGSSQGGVGAQQLPDTAAYQAGWQSCCLPSHSERGSEVLW